MSALDRSKRWAASTMAAVLLVASAGAALAQDKHRAPRPPVDPWGPIAIPRAEPLTAIYQSDCTGPAISQGLCLLGSVKPGASGKFVALRVSAPAGTEGRAGDYYGVQLNERLALPPGNYELLRDDGTDDYHEVAFTVTAGNVVTLKTATVQFAAGQGQSLSLEHFKARPDRTDSNCQSLVAKSGVHAVLPGSYRLTLVAAQSGTQGDGSAPAGCRRDGIAFHVRQGEAVALNVGALQRSEMLQAKDLLAQHVYSHHTGALALTSVGALRHQVNHVALVSGFKSFAGMHNPSDAPIDALVLWGPHFGFAIPMHVNATESCGTSLAKGGLPARNLLTQCVFDGQGRLTAFQVNARSYFGFTNANGQSEPGAFTINSPVPVTGVAWKLN